MAGQARILKEGEILFRTGDEAQSMYIVRRGLLKVYFVRGNQEIPLATLNDGAIVGEMAFFDQKPRSAHVKALAQSEVNEITRADFDRLLTQIPKWFVTILQSLSGRLRTTNEKLAAFEQGQQGASSGPGRKGDYPLVPIVRTLRILQLLIPQIGQKEGSTLILDHQSALEWWLSLTGWSRDYWSRFIEVLDKQGLVNKKGEDGKPHRLVIPSRARLQSFTDFVANVQSKATFESVQAFDMNWISTFEAALAESAASGYDAYNVPVSRLSESHPAVPTDFKTRMQIAEELAQWLQLKSKKSKVEMLLRVPHKEHKNTVLLLRTFHVFLTEKLDSIG